MYQNLSIAIGILLSREQLKTAHTHSLADLHPECEEGGVSVNQERFLPAASHPVRNSYHQPLLAFEPLWARHAGGEPGK